MQHILHYLTILYNCFVCRFFLLFYFCLTLTLQWEWHWLTPPTGSTKIKNSTYLHKSMESILVYSGIVFSYGKLLVHRQNFFRLYWEHASHGFIVLPDISTMPYIFSKCLFRSYIYTFIVNYEKVMYLYCIKKLSPFSPTA